jgi:hypothetical protein
MRSCRRRRRRRLRREKKEGNREPECMRCEREYGKAPKQFNLL